MGEVRDEDFFLESDDVESPAAPDPATLRAEREAVRIAEALVFASAGPVSENFIADRVPRGIDPALEPKVVDIGQHMVHGKLDALTPGSWNIVLGQDLATQLGVVEMQ